MVLQSRETECKKEDMCLSNMRMRLPLLIL